MMSASRDRRVAQTKDAVEKLFARASCSPAAAQFPCSSSYGSSPEVVESFERDGDDRSKLIIHRAGRDADGGAEVSHRFDVGAPNSGSKRPYPDASNSYTRFVQFPSVAL